MIARFEPMSGSASSASLVCLVTFQLFFLHSVLACTIRRVEKKSCRVSLGNRTDGGTESELGAIHHFGENTMKALVKSRDERGLWVDDVPNPSIGINDVLIKVQMAGICGTDLHIYEWDSWARSTVQVPTVIGHEFVGEIVDVGSNVTDFRPGMIVSGEGHVVCGRCQKLSCRTAASMRADSRSGRESARRVRRIHLACR